MQSFTSNIIWECPKCNYTNNQEAEVPELNFAAEKTSDMAVDDVTEIVCEGCDTEFYGHVFVNAGSADFEIEEPHKFSITGEMPMYGPEEDDYFFNTPDDPYSIAREALGQLSSMIGKPGPDNDFQFMNRLVFVGAVSTMEAYLGDTLINAVQAEADIRTNLLKNNQKLGDEKITAAELAVNPDAMAHRIVIKLREFLYHNLQAVSALYKDAFDIGLTPSKTESDILFQAMSKRHDCVHRNGRNKDGEKLNDFTDDYVIKVVDTITKVVDHVEDQRTGPLPF